MATPQACRPLIQAVKHFSAKLLLHPKPGYWVTRTWQWFQQHTRRKRQQCSQNLQQKQQQDQQQN